MYSIKLCFLWFLYQECSFFATSVYYIDTWCLLWRIHNMLTHVAGVMASELWFAKKCIKFIKMALISENNTVSTIGFMGAI